LTDWLGHLSGSPLEDTGPLGKRDEFRQGLDLHFSHHPVAMGLDALRRAYCASYLFVGLAANDKVEDLLLAQRQYPDPGVSWRSLLQTVIRRC
jgi:hypothetical protein